MRSLTVGLSTVLAFTSTYARADSDDLIAPPAGAEGAATSATPTEEAPSAVPVEVGLYTGTFISNYYHQYYQLDKFPGAEGQMGYRPELRRFSPLAGVRLAYFFLPWLGGEVDVNAVFAQTKPNAEFMAAESAKIYSGRVQLIFQHPTLSSVVVPYVSIGDGFGHLSSAFLGEDTDWPPFVGAGARFLVTDNITLRVDGRWMRAPTPQPPYTLNCNLGELMVGISYRPSPHVPEPPPPPPPAPRDSDGDGITDDKDKCPNEAEDNDLYDDTDGCPDPDNDGDGIPDTQDKCPLDAEDKDGVHDDDGCPDLDNDGDGVNDAQDKCPTEPEDTDGFQDLDGCPDLDNDGDLIPDDHDKCPNEPEVINGVDDDDGCPDKGNALIIISPDRLETLESLEFKKTTIQKDSFNLLNQLGANLKIHPEILRVRITVYVQPTNKPDDDQRLSELRAFAIREYLIKCGIDEKRLEPRGFGGTKPLVDPKSKGAKAINERVDFIILERK